MTESDNHASLLQKGISCGLLKIIVPAPSMKRKKIFSRLNLRFHVLSQSVLQQQVCLTLTGKVSACSIRLGQVLKEIISGPIHSSLSPKNVKLRLREVLKHLVAKCNALSPFLQKNMLKKLKNFIEDFFLILKGLQFYKKIYKYCMSHTKPAPFILIMPYTSTILLSYHIWYRDVLKIPENT